LLPDGQLALSQRTGLNIFHPDSLHQEGGFPPVILTDLELFDHSVSPNQERDTAIAPGYVLPDDLNRLDHIYLPPGRDFISIRFSAPEYRPGYTTHFGYRMAGIQEEWTDLEERTFLSFPKLPPGDYLLELRTGDNRDQWSEEVRTLAIHLAAPWYRRWWALTLFGVAGAGLLFRVARLAERQRQRVAAARVEEREELRRRSARDFHDEAGNHLSRVSLLTTLAERQLAELPDLGARTRVQGMLGEIGSNTQVIREGMRDFIWALDPDNDRVGELTLRLKRFGQELFAHHPAEFRAGPFSPDLDSLPLRADERRHLMLLFKEAMHNSLKHAPEATALQLDVQRLGEQLHLSWRDNGPGCEDVPGSDGLGMKSMRTRAEKIGAALSISNDGGCRVSVRLPLWA
jgi:signal transduction histidine kinase